MGLPLQVVFLCFFLFPTYEVVLELNFDFNNARTCDVSRHFGYTCVEHKITTEDKFVLEVHRLPGGKQGLDQKLPPVLLQHGLVQSSADWVITGPQRSLAYLMADKKYDVWLGNARGNLYSKEHKVYKEKEYKFWNWSWHEMGYYDLPAVINYILKATGHQKLFYVGQSMGTTMFFVMCSTRPEYNDKVIYMAALAPVAFLKYAKTPLHHLAPYTKHIGRIANFFTNGKFLHKNEALEKMSSKVLNLPKLSANIIFYIFGFNPDQFDPKLFPAVLGHDPAGTSTKTLAHYGQEMQTDFFRQYDHGPKKNFKKYGKATPPDYDLSLMTVPISLHHSESDVISQPEDVLSLFKKLKNPVGLFRINQKEFTHLDFMFARDSRYFVFDRVMDLIERFISGKVNCVDKNSADYDNKLCHVDKDVEVKEKVDNRKIWLKQNLKQSGTKAVKEAKVEGGKNTKNQRRNSYCKFY